MRRNVILIMLVLAAFMSSCGGAKSVTESGNVPGRTKRALEPCMQLARGEGELLRAAQSATSYLEDVALENAETAAVQALASRIETAIAGVKDRFNQNNQVNDKTFTEQVVKNHIKSYVSQKVSYKIIGDPSVYDNADKTITVYVCIELMLPTRKLLEGAYDTLTKDQILSTEFDRKKFVDETMEELKKLKEKIDL